MTGVHLDDQDAQGENYLTNVIAQKDNEAVEYLLKRGANPDLQDSNGQSPLHLSCLIRQHKFVELLLDSGADPAIRDRDERIPLHIASHNSDIEAVQMLTKRSPPDTLDAKDKDGNTPLIMAATEGRYGIVKCLVDAGCNTNLQNKAGRTALLASSSIQGHEKTKIQATLHDQWGNQPHRSSTGKPARQKTVKYLLKNNADANIADDQGRLPISVACYYKLEAIFTELLQATFDINKPDNAGRFIEFNE